MERSFHEKPGVKKLLGTVEVVNCTEWSVKAAMESTDGREINYQIILPASKRNEVLREIHNGASGCHFGVRKT